MTILRRRPSTGGKHAVGGNIYIALLTVLLLLSPHTARAIAQVLTQNGITLPAHVVRVLDALPVESVRDAVRREDDAATEITPTGNAVHHEPAPETVAAGAVSALPSLPASAPLPTPYFAARHVVLRSHLPGRRSPRAPPV